MRGRAAYGSRMQAGIPAMLLPAVARAGLVKCQISEYGPGNAINSSAAKIDLMSINNSANNMRQAQTATTPSSDMTEPRAHSRIYLGLALGMSVTAFWGFAYTYFIPVFAGAYPQVSPAVHIHGWSFFLWFLLLPLQAFLMATGRRRTHITLGGASVALAAVMVFTGILVASVRIHEGLSATEPDEFTTFWKGFGQLIMYNMILFVGFYGTAIARRNQPDLHKRMMILASASVLPAAIFRIIVGLTGFYWLATPGWVMPAAFFLPAVFIVIGMAYDRVAKGFVHRAYLVGLPVVLVVHALGLGMAGTAAGEAASRVMALFARVFGGLY